MVQRLDYSKDEKEKKKQERCAHKFIKDTRPPFQGAYFWFRVDHCELCGATMVTELESVRF